MLAHMFVLGMLKPLLWLLPFLILAAILKSPQFKGWIGEKAVEAKGRLRLPQDLYRPYHNVTIPDGPGTTQIDHVYVSPFGVFVVETKNYKGWIFGSEWDSQWTQSIYRKKTRFQNPLHQNFKHTKTLQELLGLPGSALHSVVVFTGDCEFKTVLPPNVCTLANFDRHVRSFQTRVLTPEQVIGACSALESGRLVANRQTQRAHVQYVRDKHKSG